MMKDSIKGYRRENGEIGIRNHIAVISTVICSSSFTEKLVNIKDYASKITHQHGCVQSGRDLERTFNILAGFGKNPNVAAVLIVALGCEAISYDKLADEISKTGKPVETLVIQDTGYKDGIEKGKEILDDLKREVEKSRLEYFDMDELIVAVECGGSDWTSALASNPAVGAAVDKLVDKGARVVFSETPEIIGGEYFLIKRCKNKDVQRKLLAVIDNVFRRADIDEIDIVSANPTPGNIAGGISTIEEKSLGAILKSGSTEIVDVLEYGEKIPREKGCYFMDTPGHDMESICGMVAGGAQLVIFTTGRGTPAGNPIAPVIKVTGNPDTYRRLRDMIDIYVGIVERIETIEEAYHKIYNKVIEVASGNMTKSELNGNIEFAINRIGYTY